MSAASCKQSGRREFIHRSWAAVAGVPLFSASCSRSEERVKKSNSKPLMQGNRVRPTVVSRSDAKVFATHGHDQRRVRDLVNRAVSDLVGVNDHREAFRALFAPDDVVAIKLNCLAGPGMSSSVSVVDALVAGLRSTRIKNRHIILW